jgi:hypothetical protein
MCVRGLCAGGGCLGSGAEEGRGKLRKARGRCMRPLIPGSPNGNPAWFIQALQLCAGAGTHRSEIEQVLIYIMTCSTRSISVGAGEEINRDAGSKIATKLEAIGLKISEELCYVIGVMLGDGTIYKYRGHCYKTDFVGSCDTNFVEYVAKIVTSKLGIKVYVRRHSSRNCWYAQNFENKIGELFSILGIPTGNKTHIIKIPEWLWKLPLNFRLRVFEGFLDAEGYVGFKKVKWKDKTYIYPYIEIRTVSKTISEDISKILDELKIKHSKFLTKRNESAISICGNSVLKLKDLCMFSYKLINFLIHFKSYCFQLRCNSPRGERNRQRANRTP